MGWDGEEGDGEVDMKIKMKTTTAMKKKDSVDLTI